MGRHREPLTPELRAISQRMRVCAVGHGGVITAARCGPLGADASVIRRLLGTGEWRRARRGVYRDTGFVPRRLSGSAAALHARCAALVAVLGGGVAVSHTTAARLWGLPLPPGASTEVVLTRRPPARSNGLGGATRVHVAEFSAAEVHDLHGVPVLGGARLVLDCCSTLRPPDALAVADAALRRNLTTGPELQSELRGWAGRPGVRAAALVVGRTDPRAENRLESVSRWWLAEAGLPRPTLQQPFTDGLGSVRARVDFWFPEQRVVGEADGEGEYAEPGARYAEKRREDWLRDYHRVEVVRWVTEEMLQPRARAGVIDRVRRALDRRARPPPVRIGRLGRAAQSAARANASCSTGVSSAICHSRAAPLRSAPARSPSSGGDQHSRRNSSGCNRFSTGTDRSRATAATPARAALSRAAASGSRSAHRATGGGPSAGAVDSGSCAGSRPAASATAANQ